MRNVSKNVFLNALTCPVLGWMLRTGEAPRPRLTLGDRFRFEQGREIGRRARTLYPDGLMVADVNLASAARKTTDALQSSVPAIFEGAFLADGFVTRADVLEQEAEGWHLIEVKSGTNDRVEYIDDMAHTYMVADSCGLKMGGVSLLLVSRDFRLGMVDDALFARIDHTDEVLARVEELETVRREIEETTRAEEKPGPQLIMECRHCDLFRSCMGKGIKNHIFDLPRLSQARFDQLVEQGIVRIEDIPNGFDLTENQTRVKDCVQRGESYVGEGLRTELETIEWPAYYLDFETMMTAIPLYPDIAPYTQLPTQYSIHVCSDVDRVIEHREYLADPAGDCRRELAECLLRDLGGQGSIISYSSFEKAVINGLAQLFPDLTGALGALRERIVDLEAIIRKNYYHPDFYGSTSIKATLPALVSGMSYKGMEISEGDSASAAFAYLAMGTHWKPDEVDAVKQNLLKYCKQDTLAMVKLHEKLADVVKP